MIEALDLGALPSSDGFFLPRAGVSARPFTADERERERGYRHVFSYAGSRPSIKEAALELLASARRRVFVASFRIGEPDLIDALHAAANRLRGGVYIISALDERSLRAGLSIEDVDVSVDIRAQNKRFEDLTRRGIAVRGHENCHAKLLVVDDRAALVSSANLETPALVGSAERGATGESGVVVTEPGEIARLVRFFTRLWYGCSWELPPGEAHTVQHRAPSPSPCRVEVAAVGPRPAVIWTHDDEQGILDTIHDVIGRARERLLLSTFSLNGMADRPELLLEPIARALAAHPLEVSLLARERNHFAVHRRDAQALAQLGVRVYGDSLNHAKAVIADRRAGALFSANFDAKHGLLSGVEAGVRLDGEPALRAASRYFDHALAHATSLFAAHPSQRELDSRLVAPWRTRWPLEDELLVRASGRTWQRFRAAAARPPVLFTRDAGAVRLHAGDGVWTLGDRLADGSRPLSPADGPAVKDAAQLLRSWLSPRGEPANERTSRGFCPAAIRRQPLAS